MSVIVLLDSVSRRTVAADIIAFTLCVEQARTLTLYVEQTRALTSYIEQLRAFEVEL